MNPSDPHPFDLSLILPLYNEGALLEANLRKILQTLDHAAFSSEIILIDDKSSDESASVGKRFAEMHANRVRFLQHATNQGRGATVMEGMRQAKGRVIGFLDVDCEAAPSYLLDFVPDIIDDRADIITGRRVYPLSARAFPRIVLSLSYRLFEQFVLHIPYGDRQSGYKFFNAERTLPLLDYATHHDWFWDTEIMCLAEAGGLRIDERPVVFLRNPQKRSTVRVFRDSYRLARAVVSYRPDLRRLRTSLSNERALQHREVES